MKDHSPISTQIEFGLKLNKDEKWQTTCYEQIVRILMYLIATRPNIMHCFKSNEQIYRESNKMQLLFVKRIFHYL